MKNRKIERRSFLKTAASVFGLSLIDVVEAYRNILAQEKRAGNSKMPRKKLGSTGALIPILQLGTAQSMDQEYDKIMHRCYREGVDCIDTALSYGWGSSHQAIANFVKQIGGRRKIWITSKSSSWTLKGLIKDVDKCLESLETDYLDLYLMHGINRTSYLDRDFIRAGEKLRQSGKIRFFGFSSHGWGVVSLMNRAVKTGGIDAVLFSYNFRRYGDKELNLAMDACRKKGIGLLAMKTMGGVSAEAEKVVKFRSQNFNLSQAKLKSVWADERIDSIVSEMQNTREVKENIAAAKSEQALSAGDVQQLNRLVRLTAHLACLGCSHLCESTIEGKTRIADSLRFLMYHEVYGKTVAAREMYQALSSEGRHFEPQDMAKASAVCPQGIDIAERLKKISQELV